MFVVWSQQPTAPDNLLLIFMINIAYIAEVGEKEMELQGASVGGNLHAMLHSFKAEELVEQDST